MHVAREMHTLDGQASEQLHAERMKLQGLANGAAARVSLTSAVFFQNWQRSSIPLLALLLKALLIMAKESPVALWIQ